MTARALRTALLAALITTLPACDDDPGPPVDRDLSQIAELDTLVALVTYNSTGYFVYRGQPMGLEYELLREFAQEHDLELRTRLVRDRDRVLHMLNEGEGDVAAARVVPARRDSPHVVYSRPLYETQAALVQRTEPPESADLPEAADTITDQGPDEPLEIRARLIRSPEGLADEEVHVPERTFYEDRLVELSDSLGEDIQVVEVDSVSHETLIRQVARGGVRLTVSPENVAELRESYFANITVQPTVSPAHDVTFAMRPNAAELKQALDAFIAEAEAAGRLDALYQKYFLDRQGIQERVESEYLTSETGRLSEYDEMLKRHAPTVGWDWRLLASQAYQESKFQPQARSWAGAMGILQLMPATAAEVDVANPMDPEENIAGGVRYLRWLSGQWEDEIADPEQRLRFILASYNAGFGHVSDARRLAEDNGDNPDQWEDVAYWLLQKSKRSVYTLPVVRYGYCRGLEPVTYVARILERYSHYQEFVEG